MTKATLLPLNEQQANWITAAGEAFTAIRLVTGYGRRMAQPLDEDTVYAVTQLADMLHNIGQFATGNGGLSSYHTPENLERVRASTRALIQRYNEGLPVLRHITFDPAKKPGLIARMAQAITGKRV